MPVGNMKEHKQRIVVENQGWFLSVKVLVGEIQDRDIVKDGSQPVARPFPDLELLRADGRHDRNLVGGPRTLDIFLKGPQAEREREAQLFKLAISSAQAETSVWRQKCWWAAWRHCR